MFKNIDETRLVIYGAAALGTAYLYNAMGLIDILNGSKRARKDFNSVMAEIKPEMLSACYYYDGLPSVIDEKSQANSALRARLYYYGSPIDYPNPPIIREAPKPTPTPDNSNFWGGLVNASNNMINASENPAIDQRVLIYNIIRDAINMGNSTLPQKIPPEEEVKFLTGVYNEYKSKILASWNVGIKTRIPHQPYLSCLPIVFEVIRKAGYESMFNETSALYRCISYQETMRRELPVDDKKVIVDGINVSTGKTVVEEPPPPDSVVIPTRGPNAGKVIPIGDTAIM